MNFLKDFCLKNGRSCLKAALSKTEPSKCIVKEVLYDKHNV